MPALEGGAALPVTTGGTGPTEGRVAAVPVYVVSGGPVIGQRARRVVVVTSGPVVGRAAIPVYDAGANALYSNEAALPVYVVQGSLGAVVPAPVNTVLPAISGALGTLSTTDGTWLNSPSSFTYQWKRNGVNIGGATANTYTLVTADMGTTITVEVTATNAGGSTAATSAGYTPTYTQKVIALSPIAYWPQGEPSGTTIVNEQGVAARNGVYTGVTLGNTGIGDGRTAAGFDGATSFGNVYSASFAAAFSGAEGTIALWVKVANAGMYTDASSYRALSFAADGNNEVRVFVQAAFSGNNKISLLYKAGSTSKFVTPATTSLIFQHVAITWSKSADQVKVYLNGAQSGTTQTGLGTWAGALASTLTTIGARNTTPTECWNGGGAHAAVWNTPLSAAQIATLAVVP